LTREPLCKTPSLAGTAVQKSRQGRLHSGTTINFLMLCYVMRAVIQAALTFSHSTLKISSLCEGQDWITRIFSVCYKSPDNLKFLKEFEIKKNEKLMRSFRLRPKSSIFSKCSAIWMQDQVRHDERTLDSEVNCCIEGSAY
jgi:hypothetical protein